MSTNEFWALVLEFVIPVFMLYIIVAVYVYERIDNYLISLRKDYIVSCKNGDSYRKYIADYEGYIVLFFCPFGKNPYVNDLLHYLISHVYAVFWFIFVPCYIVLILAESFCIGSYYFIARIFKRTSENKDKEKESKRKMILDLYKRSPKKPS